MGGVASEAEEVADIVMEDVEAAEGLPEAKAMGFGVGGEVSAVVASSNWSRISPIIGL